MSFGRQEHFKSIQSKFEKQGLLNPIDGHVFSTNFDSQNKPVGLMTNFYLIAVPSFYFDTNGE